MIPAQWTEQIATWLLQCPPGIYPVEQMRKDAEQGCVALFEVWRSGKLCAVTIVDVVDETLRILALAGRLGGIAGAKSFFESVELLAELLGLKKVWVETPRRGGAKLLRICGYAGQKKYNSTFEVFCKPIGNSGDALHHGQQ